jgi:hypothetical protein
MRPDADFQKSMGVFKNRRPRTRTSAIRVEIVVDPVHFCSSAVKARAKALHLMTKLRMQAGMNLARISSLTSQDFGET